MRLDQDANQWSLFGYDMRSIGQLWTGAWRDFLFSEQSPLRARLDEPVRLVGGEGEAVYLAGAELGDPAGLNPRCTALSLPEDLYLARSITLPAAAESELESVLAMEMSANSPFSADDTVSGWREVLRSDDRLTVVLAVAARSAVMQWLNREHPQRSAAETELWASHEGVRVPLNGFGEGIRDRLYRRRLLRVAGLVLAGLALVYLVLGLFVVQQRIVLSQYAALQARVSAASGEVTEQREELIAANAAIEAANELVATYPNPHVELARLTRLLDDDAYLAHFSMRGRDLRLRGRALDAARVMQSLTEDDAFVSVTAPQAITAVGNTGQEQFYLDVQLAGVAPGDGT
jgi:Tfp pilus assembly protein PilN